MKRRWLKHVSRDAVVIAFRDWFGVQQNHAEVLATLFERQGRPIKPRALGAEVSTHRPLGEHAVMERISSLRAHMESEAIDTTARGYALTEVGMAECRNALTREAEALVRHGLEIEAAIIAEEREDMQGLPLMRLAAAG